MKVLLTGASGQLGWELCRRGPARGLQIVALDRQALDITEPQAVEQTVSDSDAHLVVNTAAYTAVDKAETEPELAFAVNRDGPALLASACARAGVPLLHVSTDYVFDGSKKGPYLETDPVSPLGVYGRSKAAGEEEIRSRLPEHVIVRTSWLYGIHGRNFVKTMLWLGAERQVLQVVADQYGCPTCAADLAEALLTIGQTIVDREAPPYGTYHYCGKGSTTWHGFAREIFTLARAHIPMKVKRVEAITTEDYPTPAKRPLNSVLDCSILEKEFGIKRRPWPESLADMIEELSKKAGRLGG